MRSFLQGTTISLIFFFSGVSLVSASPVDSALVPDSPFVICQDQRYALCAAASCFVYNGVAYCECNVKQGNSISLQLSYTSPSGEQNVCDVNQDGRGNGYVVSTFSLPNSVKQGGTAAIYTCPGTSNAGSGVSAPVAYGQCDGGICFTSSSDHKFPGFRRLRSDQVICSCPISNDATPGSADSAGYQIFGAYHPDAPAGSRCDASACAFCAVNNPTANGATIKVGSPTGAGEFLTLKLCGSPLPAFNQCQCECTNSGPDGAVTCSVAADTTP
jgi:hypothetical protein